jgi:hypothetical protein
MMTRGAAEFYACVLESATKGAPSEFRAQAFVF